MRSFLLQSCSNSIHWYRIKTINPQRPQRCWGFFVTMGRNYSFETKMRWVKLRFLGLAGIHYDIRWLLLWAIAAARLNYISIYYVFVARHLGSDRIEINPRISTRGIVANIKAEKALPNLCKHCGRPLDNTAGQRKSFCSDKCRIEWWKADRRKK